MSNGPPSLIEVFEPVVVRSLVAQLPPDSFLRVEPRLIGRQVLHVNLTMGRQVLSNPRPPMPARAIHEQVQDLSRPSLPQTGQQSQEALGVTPRRSHQTIPAFPGGHPAKDIQTSLVVTGRGDAEGLTPSRPHPADARVFGKTRLVLKDRQVPLRPLAEFFLSAAGSAPHLGLVPAGRHNCPASADSPDDAAISALGGRSTPLQSVVAGEVPESARPRPREEARAARESVPSAAPTVAASGLSGRWDDRTEAAPEPPPPPLGSPGAPNGSDSYGLNQTADTERSDDNRLTAIRAPQPLDRAKLPEPPRPTPITSPASHRNARCLTLS